MEEIRQQEYVSNIPPKLAESNLQNKELIERSTCAICTGRCTRAEPWIAHMQSSTIF